MVLPATQLRVGMVIMYNNDLYRVTNVVHITPGNWRGMVQTKLRSIRTGNSTENRFRSEDKVDRITLEQHEMEYLYSDGEQYHFMNTENYEQIPVGAEKVGDANKYLKENDVCEVVLYGDEVIGIELPISVELTITQTDPGFKGDTATGGTKPATLETGLVVQVPLFLEEGARIKVNTDTASYIERVQ